MKIDPKTHYVAISKTAGTYLKMIVPSLASLPFEAMRKKVLAGLNVRCDVVLGTKELHFIVETTICDRDVALLCVTSNGSPAGVQEFTTCIRGAVNISDVDDVLLRNKGLTSLHIRKGKDISSEMVCQHCGYPITGTST